MIMRVHESSDPCCQVYQAGRLASKFPISKHNEFETRIFNLGVSRSDSSPEEHSV